MRLALGNLVRARGSLDQAIEQYDEWLDAHLQEIRTPEVLASRCRARAMLGQNLDKALADCNRAVKERPQAVVYLDARGLTYLRLGQYDKALKDYDAVLASQPRNPWALYGRGLVELHNGNTTKGQADIAASKSVDPRVAQEAAKRGLVAAGVTKWTDEISTRRDAAPGHVTRIEERRQSRRAAARAPPSARTSPRAAARCRARAGCRDGPAPRLGDDAPRCSIGP